MNYDKLLSTGSWIGLLTMAGSFSLCGAEEANRLSSGAPVANIKRLSFRNDIQPIFDANCVSCHMTGSAGKGLILESDSSYQALVRPASRQNGPQFVSPAKPDESYLIQKLKGTHLNRLDSKSIDALRTWVIEGAPDN